MLLRGRGLNFFYLSILKQHIIPCRIYFRFNALQGITKAPAVDLLRLKILRDTKTAFLTPKRYDEHPLPLCIGIPRGLQLRGVTKARVDCTLAFYLNRQGRKNKKQCPI